MKKKKIIFLCFLTLFFLFSTTQAQMARVNVSFIDWEKTGFFLGEEAVYSLYSVNAKVQNLEKTGEVHVVLQALDHAGNEVGRGEIFGYIEFGDTKTLTRQIKIWGDPWIKEWRVERTYVIEN